MDFKKIVLTAKTSANNAVNSPEVDMKVYCTIAQASAILNRSVYRVRQLYWDGRFPNAVKGEKLVYLTRADVQTMKKLMESRSIKNDTLDDSRLGKRIVFASDMVKMIVNQDTDISADMKKQISAILDKYIIQAKAMVK